MIRKVLVANRGEIAIRVLRACKELGILTATVYSEADRSALHTRYADEAYEIGPAPAAESYLKIDKIIEVAKKTDADAIHPGYGFLAENEYFAEACESHNIIFIGPNSKAIRLLGDKIEARKTITKAKVPVTPGSSKGLTSEAEAIKVVNEVGFPVLIKAAAGGGGKGMRVVKSESELKPAMKQAMSEAKSAFGNPTIYIEKYLDSPRHIEFQILADNYGNAVHLCERECSIQRRYQKLVEESPSPLMTKELRAKMGAAAVKAVKASGYTNAGTVEFMVDKDRNFYFLEMNTRLQVEHPVTELVTGIDIVKEQLKIAAGERLSIKQEDVKLSGAAIECRITAEDPDNNFMPSTGKIVELIEPNGPGVRVDSGVFAGFEVPMFYDPLIAKLLVWAPTRDESISRMRRALSEYKIIGIKTSIPFHQLVMNNQYFISGEYNTTFVDKMLGSTELKKTNQPIAAIGATIAMTLKEKKVSVIPKVSESRYSAWKFAARQAELRKM
ncbi:MAG: acetyl-CoA carboxylase biotin carboxylase subunit [bacterium]|nr:acetyl-CoA carboxylase biotin carboxylase subunit [bacterium]